MSRGAREAGSGEASRDAGTRDSGGLHPTVCSSCGCLLGLALDSWDLDFYTKRFQELKRNPSTVEAFDLAQSNRWEGMGAILMSEPVEVGRGGRGDPPSRLSFGTGASPSLSGGPGSTSMQSSPFTS